MEDKMNIQKITVTLIIAVQTLLIISLLMIEDKKQDRRSLTAHDAEMSCVVYEDNGMFSFGCSLPSDTIPHGVVQ